MEAASSSEQFQAELEAREAALGKQAVILGKLDLDEDSEGEDVEPTLDQLRALDKIFVPQKAVEYIEAVDEELGMVGRDSPEDFFRMLNTSHSYEGHDILRKHLTKINSLVRNKSWEDAFCALLGVTEAARRDEFWYADTEAPDEVTAIVKALLSKWKSVLKQPGDALGGLTEDDKRCINKMLKGWKQDMQQFGIDGI